MAITVVPSVVTGQTYSAANFNTHVRDNINGIWVLTTAGDMLYATGASAAARLALVPGGVMYGGASAPAWLATPSVTSLLRKASGTGAPDWLPVAQFPGALTVFGSAFMDSGVSSTSTSFASTTVSTTISLAYTSAILAFAFGVGGKASGTHPGYFAIQIDGVAIDTNLQVKLSSSSNLPFSCAFRRASVAAGSQTVKLMYKTDNAADAVVCDRAFLMAFAIPE